MIRRALDIVVSAALLVLSAPLMLAAIVAIRLESRGPAIYRQRRSGLHGAPFDMLKLRTMVDGAEHIGAGLAVNADDSRITRVGALLRRTSLDELPNLVNVLRGEMSLIGPRPTLPAQVAQYTAAPARAPGGQARHHRLGAGQRPRLAAVVRAHRARPLLHRAPLARARPEDPAAHARARARRRRPLQGPVRRLAGRAVSPPAVLLTGAGKRYDIVSCFARLTKTVVADPSPLAPAQYAAHVRAAVPLIDDPRYVPRCASCASSTTSAPCCRSPTSTSRCSRVARAERRLPALVPSPEVARATYDKYETHLLLEQRRAALAADRAARRRTSRRSNTR